VIVPGRFAGKRVAITGAASGLGREVARRMAAEGTARLALIDRDAAGLEETAAGLGGVAERFVCDVSEVAAVAAVWSRVAAWGGLDVLVTAAGILGPAVDVASCAPEDWDRVFAVNVRGTYLAFHHGVPLLRAAGGGAIVAFSSTAGLAASATLGPYSASKGAIIMMVKSAAVAHAMENIRVNAVCPGSIDTPMLEANLAAGNDRDARTALFRARHPMNRFGRPEEVAAAVLFLASDEASYMTGVCLPVDGGRLA
jgi:NAD(P)-dependent dehydrogenase (short-subunit alcohol dehydrogenase family)